MVQVPGHVSILLSYRRGIWRLAFLRGSAELRNGKCRCEVTPSRSPGTIQSHSRLVCRTDWVKDGGYVYDVCPCVYMDVNLYGYWTNNELVSVPFRGRLFCELCVTVASSFAAPGVSLLLQPKGRSNLRQKQ